LGGVALNFTSAKLAYQAATGATAVEDLEDFFKNFNLEGAFRGFATGGIVKSPTLGLIGEAGPEAVVPLSKGNMLGSTTINLTVNAGYGADGRSIGDAIVNELKKWSRKNGKVPVPTQ